MTLFKQKPLKSPAIRRSAEGETCTGQIPGHCVGGAETTVFAHLSFEGGKMGGKVSDIGGGAYLCWGCHRVLDFRELKPEAWDFYAGRAIQRTLQRLYERGLIQVK